MKLLLDTRAFLWFLVYFSAVSAWEIAHKYAQGGISLPSHPSTVIPAVRQDSGIASLSLTETDALAAEKLQLFHKDPFDRMLICQAVVNGFAVLTPDELISQYPIRTLW